MRTLPQVPDVRQKRGYQDPGIHAGQHRQSHFPAPQRRARRSGLIRTFQNMQALQAGAPAQQSNTHLFGGRDASGAEAALCDSRGGIVLFAYQLNGTPGRFVSCQECLRIAEHAQENSPDAGSECLPG